MAASMGEIAFGMGSGNPLPGFDLDDFHRVFPAPPHLQANVLMFGTMAMPEREHDRPNHCDEENSAGEFKEIDIFRVENAADRDRICHMIG